MYHFLFIGHSSVFSNFDVLSPGNQQYYIVIMEPHNKIHQKSRRIFPQLSSNNVSNRMFKWWEEKTAIRTHTHTHTHAQSFCNSNAFTKVPIVSNLKITLTIVVSNCMCMMIFFFNATITFIPQVFLIYNAKNMKIVEKIPSTNNNFCNSHSSFFYDPSNAIVFPSIKREQK